MPAAVVWYRCAIALQTAGRKSHCAIVAARMRQLSTKSDACSRIFLCAWDQSTPHALHEREGSYRVDGQKIYKTSVISEFDNKIIEQSRRFPPTRRTRSWTSAIWLRSIWLITTMSWLRFLAWHLP